MIKGMKELQSIDLDQMQKFMEILAFIKGQESGVKQDTETPQRTQGGPEVDRGNDLAARLGMQ